MIYFPCIWDNSDVLYLLPKDPTLVARSAAKNRSNPTRMKQKYSGNSAETTNRAQTFKTTGGGSLMNQLKKERQQMQSASGSRHSHFAGTLVSQKAGGQQRFRSMSALNKSSSRGGFKSAKPSTSAKRKTKKHQYFIGSGRSQAVHTREGVVSSNPTQMSGSLASRRSQRVLHDFCIRFMTQCYGPVMKSLKNEFRRDSSRLESDDKVVFFRLVCFFTQWWRVAINEGGLTKTMLTNNDSASGNDQQQKSIGHLIFTMDVFTFNLVFTAADSFLAHKKYKSLSQAVALYAEMMHLLNTMYNSSDSTENLMAMGLMDRLFYQSEAIDRLPNLLSSWIPGTFSREYLCDILELTHLTLKLLDINEKACKDYHIGGKKGKSRKLEQEPKDAVSRMKSSAADFDVINYLARKIFSNHTVFMFTQLLSQYNVNATHINDHVVSFFVRLCKFVVASEQDDEFQTEKVEDVTLEPMLFNLPLLAILNEILNDSTLEGDHSFDSFLKFAATVVRHFARAAERNPLLHVEALFRHPVPHKFCESSSNLYVPEEFRMIVERDMLLEQSREDDESIVEEEVPAPAEIADAEEELEFVDDDKELKKSEPQKEATSSNNNDSDDESDGSENNTMNRSVQKSKSTSIEKEIVKDLSKIEKELDEEEERWNDRRSFVPKRKLTVLCENKDEGAGRRDDASVEDFALPKKMNRLDPKRIRRAALLDDSDDEEFGNVMEKANLSSTGASARMLLEDSDED
jgi:timeless